MSKQNDLPSFLERHRILSVDQTAEVLGFSTAHLRRLYRTGKFPRPIQIGGRKLGYQAGFVMDMTMPSSSTGKAA